MSLELAPASFHCDHCGELRPCVRWFLLRVLVHICGPCIEEALELLTAPAPGPDHTPPRP